MDTGLKVFNFGHSALKNEDSFKYAGQLMSKFNDQPILIFATALEGASIILENILKAHQQGDIAKAMSVLNELRNKHYRIAAELLGKKHSVFDELNDLLVTIEWDLEDPPHENIDFASDQIMATGTLLSTQILSAYLNELKLNTHWQDARDIIMADDEFKNGTILEATRSKSREVLLPKLATNNFVVTQAGLGTTSENYSIGLKPHEGSAYSAAQLADYLEAQELYIWTKPLTDNINLTDNIIKFEANVE